MEATFVTPAIQSSHRVALRIGRIVTAVPVLFLVFDSVIKLIVAGPVVTAFGELGYPVHLASVIGALELVCLSLYLVPRTSLLGAVLLTGYLGGAVASHVRIESPLLTHTLFPIYVGVLLWAGLVLRDGALRSFILGRAATGRA